MPRTCFNFLCIHKNFVNKIFTSNGEMKYIMPVVSFVVVFALREE